MARKKKKRSKKKGSAGYPWPVIKTEPAEESTYFYEKFFWISAGVIALFMIFTSFNTGINGDDFYQHIYEEKLIDYYSSFGEDTSALFFKKHDLHLYGGFFEVTTGVANRILGIDGDESYMFYQVRHFFIALFGLIALLAISLIIKMIAGWRAAVITLILAFLIPRFTGHAMMNPKDIPFAAGYMMSLYFTFRLLAELPKPSWKTVAGLILGMGIALGIRVGGLLVFGFVGLFGGIHFLLKYGFSGLTNWKKLRPYLFYGMGSMAAGFIFAILFWPYALQDPFTNVKATLDALSDYRVNINLLFEGNFYRSQLLPWYYPIKWIWITMPLALMLGLILYIILSFTTKKSYSRFVQGSLIFAAVFPIAYIIYRESTLYDGLRHVLFVLPVLAGLAALGFDRLRIAYIKNKKWDWAIIISLIVLLNADVIGHYIINNNLMYVYFNPLQGGLSNVYDEYELDYWGVAMKGAVEWMEEEEILPPEDTMKLSSNLRYPVEMAVKEYFDNMDLFYLSSNNRYGQAWDYGIYNSRFVHPALLEKAWPPSQTIHSIRRDGVPIVSILKSDNIHTMIVKARKEGCSNVEAMYTMYRDGEKDAELLETLADCLTRMNREEEALEIYEKLVEQGNAPRAYQALGLIYLNQRKPMEALQMLNKAADMFSDQFDVHYYLAIAQQATGNLEGAYLSMERSLELNPFFAQGYQLAATLAEQTGRPGKAAEYRAKAQNYSQ